MISETVAKIKHWPFIPTAIRNFFTGAANNEIHVNDVIVLKFEKALKLQILIIEKKKKTLFLFNSSNLAICSSCFVCSQGFQNPDICSMRFAGVQSILSTRVFRMNPLLLGIFLSALFSMVEPCRVFVRMYYSVCVVIMLYS